MKTDTTPAQLERHAALIRALSPAARAAALRAVDRGMRRLTVARLRARHPGDSERELVIRAFAEVHGVALARKVYGSLPTGLTE